MRRGALGVLGLAGFALAAACGPAEPEQSVSAAADDGLTVGGYSCPQSGTVAISTIPANNEYYLSTFTGGTMACGGQADGVSLYVADKQRFGCGASLRVTNPATGASCVAPVKDLGPNLCVEEAAGMPVIDASPVIAQALFGTNSAGWSDGFLVVAALTTDPVGCSSAPSGSSSSGSSSGSATSSSQSVGGSTSSGSTGGSTSSSGSTNGNGSSSGSTGSSGSGGGGLCFVTSLGLFGECLSTAACAAQGDVSTPGYCTGASNVECCTAPGGSGSSSSSSGGSSGGTTSCYVTSLGVSGECMLTTDCATLGDVSTPGYCPGAADIECCTPPGASGSSSSGSGTSSSSSGGAVSSSGTGASYAPNGGGPGTVCAVGSTLQGADLSDYQGAVDWTQVAGAGLSFAIAKATEGITLQDTQFAANWSGMQQNGIVRGAYHFFHSLDDGTAQADAFLAAVSAAGGFQSGDMPPFLDWEATDSGDTSANAIAQAQAFIDEIQAKTGLTTIIYTDPGFWEGLGDTSQFGAYPLWLANIQVSCPDVPAPWSGWVIWQYDWYGTIAGMNCPGACDLDEFDGTLADLQSL